MIRHLPALFLFAASLAACGERPRSAPVADSTRPAPARPADSLVLEAPGGVEVWFTDAREAQDSSGRACTERVMQIRRDGSRVAVPLLYTGEAPRLVNDSTMQAAIWLHCRPGNVYQVNLRTGYPVRVK